MQLEWFIWVHKYTERQMEQKKKKLQKLLPCMWKRDTCMETQSLGLEERTRLSFPLILETLI